jgi:ABC-type multidrug transport system ATPase subunit
VILSTHIVSDVESTATHIVLANHGRLLMNTSPEKLLEVVEGRVWEWTISSDELVHVKNKYLVSGTLRRSNGLQLRLIADRAPDSSALTVSPTFEDAYLKIISSNGRVPQLEKVRI